MIVMVAFNSADGHLVFVNPEQVVAVRYPHPDEFEDHVKAVIVSVTGHWGVRETPELARKMLEGQRK